MSNAQLTFSSELMKNYLHAELISPQKKFEALQTTDGHTLLFAIDTDGVFNLICESSGQSAAGWSKIDLSSARIKLDFPGQTNAACRTFEAGQSASDGSLGIAMVVTGNFGDQLYLCLGNSNTDISWASAPNWQSVQFDNPMVKPATLEIAHVFLGETGSGGQYIVVDILRDPASPVQDVIRFYIDPTKTDGYYWHRHDLPVDIETGHYSSCMGRLPNGMVDGIYTAGKAGSSGQLVFAPLINIFGDGPPMPTRLDLPGGIIADAIAATRNPDMSTDLFVTSGSALYYFASVAQQDSATATLLFEHSLLLGVTRLFAYRTDSQTYIWGLNQDDQVFYSVCANQALTTATAWSHPLPILSGIDQVSPYVNRANSGNTLFAVGDDVIFKMTRSPQTGLWTSHRINMPALAPTTVPHSFSSYTTRLQLSDDNNRPLANSPLMLSALSRGSFFINNLYYVLDTTPIAVNTDQLGSVTIIESVDNTIHGTRLAVSVPGGTTVSINPMDGPMNKVAQLNSEASLTTAVITKADGSTRPLVPPDTPSSNLKTVAKSNSKLMAAYTRLASSAPRHPPLLSGKLPAPRQTLALDSVPQAIVADAGDIFQWLESGVESAVEIVEDAVSGVWSIIAKIAGKVYQGILDSAEAVVGAVKWVFNAIKTAIEDLILFLEFLFLWKDIVATHKVMKNVFTQYVRQAITNLRADKAEITAAFTSLQNDINKWADIPPFGQTPNATAAAHGPLDGQHSAPANLGLHHFQGNASAAVSSYTPPTFTEAIFKDLLDLLSREEATLSGAANALKTDIIDQFGTLSLTQILQKFLAIVADGLLQTTENIVLAVVDVFAQLAGGILDLLTAKIDIPVLSWLYHEVADEDLSFLDLICLISAIPATIVYKIVEGSTPFPHDAALTKSLISAIGLTEVQQILAPSGQPSAAPQRMMVEARLTATNSGPAIDGEALKTFAFVTGFCTIAGALGLILASFNAPVAPTVPEGQDPLPAPDSIWPKIAAVSNIAYVSPDISTTLLKGLRWDQKFNGILTDISLFKGFVIDSKFPGSAFSQWLEFALNLTWNAPVIANIYYTIKAKSGDPDDDPAIVPDTLGNLAFNAGGMLAPFTKNKDVQVAQALLMAYYSLMMVISGKINRFGP